MIDAPPEGLLDTAEGRRLIDAQARGWRRWGPYLSDRQWGTVREDYSDDGEAWDYFPHDQARSRAYRWGEDGIAGFSDDWQRWCLGIALWNEKDAILKERLFGLNNGEGNHGEDVKELYYYLDGTPTHSYMKMLYKYPQAEFPYSGLVQENHRRDRSQPEYEILDTGVFDDDRYFDVTVEYAKAAPEDVLMRITVKNRGAAAAPLHLLPQLWARNVWAWKPGNNRARISTAAEGLRATHDRMPVMRLQIDHEATWLFCENESNKPRLFGEEAPGPYKDGINDYVVHGDKAAIAPIAEGSKVAAHLRFDVPAGGEIAVRLRYRLDEYDPSAAFADFDSVFAARIAEANEFYAALQSDIADADARLVQRQALAGMLWSKQFYRFNVRRWLAGDPLQPPPPEGHRKVRNTDWTHINNADIISMPDKWEYPWYAAWDLAFHCVTFALIDPEFAKNQILLLTHEWYMHPNGALPAYEWGFGDLNPPVHAWAAWRVYKMDAALTGRPDTAFLQRIFHKLMMNFTGWVNRQDREGRNIFQGGFLGLDNIGVFDRSRPLPFGGTIDQSDGTSWMAMYALNLMRISLELAGSNPVYQDTATKFFEHFLAIAEAMTRKCVEGKGLWEEEDQFYYDVLELPDEEVIPLRVRSIVGLIPLFAVEVLERNALKNLPEFEQRLQWVLRHRPELADLVSHWQEQGIDRRALLSLLRGHRTKMLLRRMLDENEFLSPHGVRGLSRWHLDHPFEFEREGHNYEVRYVPGEGDSPMFGGNSNWRGPVWMPINYMLVDALETFHQYYGEDFTVEYPTGSGHMANLRDVAAALRQRLCSLFLRDKDGRRAIYGDHERLQNDPGFRDLILFHEYFHGDSGLGLGASHQTGWTGLIALLLQPRRELPV